MRSSIPSVALVLSSLIGCGTSSTSANPPADHAAGGAGVSTGGNGGSSAATGVGGSAGTAQVGPRTIATGIYRTVFGVTSDGYVLTELVPSSGASVVAVPLGGGAQQTVLATDDHYLTVTPAGAILFWYTNPPACTYWTPASGTWSDPTSGNSLPEATSGDGLWTLRATNVKGPASSSTADFVLARLDHTDSQPIVSNVPLDTASSRFFQQRVAFVVAGTAGGGRRLLSFAPGDVDPVVVDEEVASFVAMSPANGDVLYSRTDGSLVRNAITGGSPTVVATSADSLEARFVDGGITWNGTYLPDGGSPVAVPGPPEGGSDAASPDGTWAVRQTIDGRNYLWSPTGKAPATTLPTSSNANVVFTDDSATLVFVPYQGSATIVDLATGGKSTLGGSWLGASTLNATTVVMYRGPYDTLDNGELTLVDVKTKHITHVDSGVRSHAVTLDKSHLVYSAFDPTTSTGKLAIIDL